MVASRLRVKAENPSLITRLAVVFADPTRLKIITELYVRPMSPTQFFETFGGVSASSVNRHFKRLEEFGWLRRFRKGREGGRGGEEHFYRAPGLAIIDTATWEELPSPIRTEFSWRIFEQFAERVRDALEAGTFDARTDRHFTWTPLVLDEEGWRVVVAAVDRLFESLFQEQDDVKLRITSPHEKPILATVGLAAFESPRVTRNCSGLSPLPPPDSPRHPVSSRDLMKIAKVFADPLMLKIVTQLSIGPMSPTQFLREFGGLKTTLYRKFNVLEEWGWLKRGEAGEGGSRRGGEVVFYAQQPVIFDSCNWSKASGSVRNSASWTIFEQLAEQVREALEAGTFESRPERHNTWTQLELDRPGWERITSDIDALFHSLFETQDEAKRRLKRSGKEPVITTVYLAMFESPRRVLT